MSSKAKTATYATVVVVCLALAMWRLNAAAPESVYPDTTGSQTGWMCQECGTLVMLTARQRNEWSLSADRVRRGESLGPTIPGAERTIFKCAACGEFSLVRARQCPRHNEWYIVRRADGELVGCAKCDEEFGD